MEQAHHPKRGALDRWLGFANPVELTSNLGWRTSDKHQHWVNEF
jgi:hypothetical protein